jgi:hypothetical protein
MIKDIRYYRASAYFLISPLLLFAADVRLSLYLDLTRSLHHGGRCGVIKNK